MFGRYCRNSQFPLMSSCNSLSEDHKELTPRLVIVEVVHDHLGSSCGPGEQDTCLSVLVGPCTILLQITQSLLNDFDVHFMEKKKKRALPTHK